jgi:D-beta-D-heptose 7-phosphate kinase/D-beta-D-heptose 1-phosphate adenosyltransferase
LIPIDPGRTAELIGRAREVRVLVVGDLMLDRYVTGSVERISPEAPVPVVRVLGERAAPGGAGNVAANATALGARCAVVGHVGRDPEGEQLLLKLAAAGVRAEGVVRSAARPTSVKTRVLAKHQQIVRFDREVDTDADGELAAELAGRVKELAAECDVLVVQDYDKGVLAAPIVEAVRREAAVRGIPWVVDPKRRRFFAYAGATVFKPNAKELGDALGEPIAPDDTAWMAAIRRRLACRHLLVTLGDRGMSLMTESDELVRLRAVAHGVYDVSGAGDTVTATVAVALAAGAGIEEAAQLANRAAAIEVAKPGVETVSAAELLSHIRAHPVELARQARPMIEKDP